jgi:hypothetical protein
MKVTERIKAVCSCFCELGTVRILPFHPFVVLLPNQKRTNACSSPISGSERLDSQANSARKAGWSFPIVCFNGINYFADLRMTFRQNFFLQDWFRNKFGVGLG